MKGVIVRNTGKIGGSIFSFNLFVLSFGGWKSFCVYYSICIFIIIAVENTGIAAPEHGIISYLTNRYANLQIEWCDSYFI